MTLILFACLFVRPIFIQMFSEWYSLQFETNFNVMCYEHKKIHDRLSGKFQCILFASLLSIRSSCTWSNSSMIFVQLKIICESTLFLLSFHFHIFLFSDRKLVNIWRYLPIAFSQFNSYRKNDYYFKVAVQIFIFMSWINRILRTMNEERKVPPSLQLQLKSSIRHSWNFMNGIKFVECNYWLNLLARRYRLWWQWRRQRQ